MSGAYGSSHWLYDAEVFQTGQSLKFNDDDSAYLSRTPTSAGNQKTWTWSSWVKRSNIGINSFIFGCGSSSSNFAFIGFSSDNTIDIRDYQSSYTYSSKTSQVFRDTSAWYHILLAADMDNSTATDRIKLFVNGERVTSFNSAPSPTTKDLVTNSAIQHVIGSGYYNDGSGVNSYLDGYLFDVHFIDGQALDPTSFIKTENNQLKPKEYFGTYGTNGFRLNFQDDVISEGFNVATYKGNGSSSGQSISGLGLSPDLVWLKERTSTSAQILVNTVRGANITLESNNNNAEFTPSSVGVESFDPDGFTIGSNNGAYNSGSDTYVAWCWKAGGAPTANNSAGAGATPTAGSVKIDGSNLGSALAGSIAATRLSANTVRGFSIGTFTKGSGNQTVAHGLGAAPDWLAVKRTNGTGSWFVYHSANTANPETDYLRFNSSNATADDATVWGDTAPTSTVFTVGAAFNSGEELIFYAWTEISSYSKFSSYTGNGSASGPSETLGFAPAYLMIKRTDSGNNWVILDTTRDPDGQLTKFLAADANQAESDSAQVTTQVDADGFTIKSAFDIVNANGGTYIYMAFADTREAAFFKDVSGNNNNFTPNNLDYRDSMIDTPLTNFNILNRNASRLDGGANLVTSEGNLKMSAGASYGGDNRIAGSYLVSSGKWYFEMNRTDATGLGNQTATGVSNGSSDLSSGQYSGNPTSSGASTVEWVLTDRGYACNGSTYTNLSGTIGTVTQGKIVQVALDMDNKKIWFGINNTYSGNPSAGSGEAFSNLPDSVFTLQYSGQSTQVFNFGQDSSFSGAQIPQGNGADGEDFFYAPPTGFKSLQLSNLPDAAIADPTTQFNTVLWIGDGNDGRSITGVGFDDVDFVWIKSRNLTTSHLLNDKVRGANKSLFSEGTYAETANNGGGYLSAFVTDGFSVTSGSSGDDAVNDSSDTYVAWNWKAGGASPSQTYVVKVVSDGGNKYRFDDFGTSAITLDLQEGGTYTFDQSDSSNSGHPFRFSTTANGTHGGGSEYTVGVTTNGTAGSAGAYTRITVASGAPTLYYYCTVHSGMGGQANTNSTFGSTNLKGATQAVVSANTTAGVSIIKYTGTGSATTVGHGLGVVPNLIIAKRRNATDGWLVYHSSRGASAYLYLNTTGSGETGVSYPWNGTSPTSSVFSVNSAASPSSSGTMIAYCFTNIESFSKAGLYVGNGSLDGVFVPLGFKPAWILTKRSNGTSWWGISDSARSTFNQVANTLAADATTTESALTSDLKVDFLSNGFKIRDTDAYYNASGENYIYIAFAEAPFKTTSAR